MRRRFVLLAVLAAIAAAVVPALAGATRQTVSVTIKEFRFVGVPKTLPAGATTFQLVNKGKFPHNFTVIYGPARFRSRTLQAGGEQALTVNLKPGTYIVVCTVGAGFHESQGMIARFTVGKFDFKTGKWSAA